MIPLKLFLDMKLSSSEDDTRATRGQLKVAFSQLPETKPRKMLKGVSYYVHTTQRANNIRRRTNLEGLLNG